MTIFSDLHPTLIWVQQLSTLELELGERMKKFSVMLVILTLMPILCACKSTAARWQEQYDLGMRYLSDGEYEEAIIAFNAAIEIDPAQADAYLSLANAYIGMNDFDAARGILERGYELTQSEALKARLEELDSGNIFDFWGNPRRRSGYDGEGDLKWDHIYEYDKKQTVSVTTYDASGAQTGYWDGYRYDEEGKLLRSMAYTIDDGRVFSIVESKYDEEGHVTRADHFGLDGSSQGYQTYEYDEAGQQTVMYDYDAEGILRTELRYTYDADRCTGYTSHDGNGTLIGRSEYLYDEQGQIVGDIMYGPDGEVLWEQTSEH